MSLRPVARGPLIAAAAIVAAALIALGAYSERQRGLEIGWTAYAPDATEASRSFMPLGERTATWWWIGAGAVVVLTLAYALVPGPDRARSTSVAVTVVAAALLVGGAMLYAGPEVLPGGPLVGDAFLVACGYDESWCSANAGAIREDGEPWWWLAGGAAAIMGLAAAPAVRRYLDGQTG